MKQAFSHSANGNTECMNSDVTSETNNGGKTQPYEFKRSMYWHRDNMMRALADENVVTHFVYDGNNERVLKLSETWHRIFTNSELSGEQEGGETEVEMFYTLYPNQYMVIRPDGHYTKHYYMGSERIASKIGDPMGYFGGDPTTQSVDIGNNTQGDLEAYVDKNYAHFEPDIEIVRPDEIEDPTLGMEDLGTASEDLKYFFHKDQVGSSSFITDSAGEPIQFIGYAGFGESIIDVSSTHFATPYRFTGQEQDAETGLYNYGARYYDPKISRFLSVDPLADQFPGWSPYNYTLNNPINMIDPDGRAPDWIKQNNDDGSVTYIAEQGDSAESLEEQHGVPFEVGNAIIQGIFGENLPNGTPEGRSNIHPGDQISIFAVENSSTDSGGGFMDWLGSFFSEGDQQQNSGDGYAIFAKGSKSGWSINAPEASSNGNIKSIDISDMFPAGGGLPSFVNPVRGLSGFNDRVNSAVDRLQGTGFGRKKVCTVCGDTLDLNAPKSYHTGFDTIRTNKP